MTTNDTTKCCFITMCVNPVTTILRVYFLITDTARTAGSSLVTSVRSQCHRMGKKEKRRVDGAAERSRCVVFHHGAVDSAAAPLH